MTYYCSLHRQASLSRTGRRTLDQNLTLVTKAANDASDPPELRGIGVRIEDDLLVTAAGQDMLSGALPIDAAGLERRTRAQTR